MQMPDTNDAEQHYLQRVAEDCAEMLGPEIELRELELDRNGEVVLRLNYRLGRADWTSEGHGETVVAARCTPGATRAGQDPPWGAGPLSADPVRVGPKDAPHR